MLIVADYLILWLRGVAVLAARTAKRVWEVSTLFELLTSLWMFLCAAVALLDVFTGTGGWATFAIVAFALSAYLELLCNTTRVRLNLWALARDKPSGAPAAVVVDCSLADGKHRLAYSGGQWREIR